MTPEVKLEQANQTVLQRLEITQHAAERFAERCGLWGRDAHFGREQIRTILQRAKPEWAFERDGKIALMCRDPRFGEVVFGVRDRKITTTLAVKPTKGVHRLKRVRHSGQRVPRAVNRESWRCDLDGEHDG